jgi:hypothetical protein
MPKQIAPAPSRRDVLLALGTPQVLPCPLGLVVSAAYADVRTRLPPSGYQSGSQCVAAFYHTSGYETSKRSGVQLC